MRKDSSDTPSGQQTFLFLQGHPSRFAAELAAALEERGCKTLKVHFCLGDVLFWGGRKAINYRGRLSSWPDFLSNVIRRNSVTDVIYYGDCRPYHAAAASVAADLGVNAFVYEFGYLRPDWLTLERGGMAGRSHFPNDAALIERVAANVPAPDLKQRYSNSMAAELSREIAYHWTSYFFHVVFPFYAADRYYNPIVEYLTGIPKQLKAKSASREADRLVTNLTATGAPFFLFPLQLQCDYQLRKNSPFDHQTDAIKLVIRSFSNWAPRSAQLVFKCHPLDNGAEGWCGHIEALAAEFGVSGRVFYIEGGDLSRLLKHAKGVVLINSTVGMHAIVSGRPTKVLGTAVFDIEGITHQGSLDDFWNASTQPDPHLSAALVRALAATIQVKGSFLDPNGRAEAVRVFADRLTNNTVNGAGAFVTPPPRQKHRKIG